MWVLLRSTAIRAVRYDERSRTLRIRFTGGGVYDYLDVPPEVVDGLVHPPEGSSGRYFADRIRDAYEHRDTRHAG